MVYPHPQDEPPPDPDAEGLIPDRPTFASLVRARRYVELQAELVRNAWRLRR